MPKFVSVSVLDEEILSDTFQAEQFWHRIKSTNGFLVKEKQGTVLFLNNFFGALMNRIINRINSHSNEYFNQACACCLCTKRGFPLMNPSG